MTNLVFLDSSDARAIRNAVEVGIHLDSQNSEGSVIVYVGQWYHYDRKLISHLEANSDRISFINLADRERISRSSLRAWKAKLKASTHFKTAMVSWLISTYGEWVSESRMFTHAGVVQRPILLNCAEMAAKCEILLVETNVSVAAIPNGRFPQEASLAIALQDSSVPITFYEKSAFVEEGVFFQQYSCHDLSSWAQHSREVEPGSEARSAATRWFQSRVLGDPAENEFAARWNPVSDSSPGDANRDLVSIFTSSMEEFMSLVPKRRGDWKSQYEAYGMLLRKISVSGKTPAVAIRLHPNLLNKTLKQKWREYGSLAKLVREFPGARVIKASSSTNSYKLVDQSAMVVVMQSTIGLESVYLGKNVVCMFESDYSFEADVVNLWDSSSLDSYVVGSNREIDNESATNYLAKCIQRDMALTVTANSDLRLLKFVSRDLRSELVRVFIVGPWLAHEKFARMTGVFVEYLLLNLFRIWAASREVVAE